MSDTSPRTEPGRIVATSIGAALVAAVLLFTAVLPAEFGFDPLGKGEHNIFFKAAARTLCADVAAPVTGINDHGLF